MRFVRAAAIGAVVALGAVATTLVLVDRGGVPSILDTSGCTADVDGHTVDIDLEQAENAALIAAISIERGMPARAASIALATAFQESKLYNIDFGDRDSVGLFQQRPSQGWGSAEQLLDPVYATNAFYDALVKLKGYETADITEIAQEVQRSAHPELYRDHEGQGRVLASTLTGHSPAGLTCRLDEPEEGATPAKAAQVKADLATQMGVTTATEADGVLTVTAPDLRVAWAVGHWAVARAAQYGTTAVSVGDRSWDRSEGDEGWSAGTASKTVRITLR